MSNEYDEGAKALLDLKKKDKKKKIEFEEDKSKDGDVEAAVLKYVGGLDNNNIKKRKKSFNNDDNEFQHWNSFLDTEQLQDDNEDKDKKFKKNKKSKKIIDVDPELANLDDNADHEQLVRAAILDANQLAQDANIQVYMENANDNQELHNSIIQAAEAVQQQQQQQQQAQLLKSSKLAKMVKDSGIDITKSNKIESNLNQLSKGSGWVRTSSMGKKFTKEEIDNIDKFLMDFCAIHSLTRKQLCERFWLNERKREVIWDLLHQLLPTRSRASIYKHVRRSYHVFEVRGKWTPEDDDELAKLYIEKNGGWKQIGLSLGRMPEDCRDRYRNYIKCGENRILNKWTPEEEERLKNLVALYLGEQQDAGVSEPTINWTIISEKLGGSRSRIQCRYKWNKLLKREATQRSEKLGVDDRVWLLTKIQELGETPQSDMEWNTLASLHPKNYWNGDDFKVAFNKMKVSIRDRKTKSTNEICEILLQDSIQEANRNSITIELPVVLQHFTDSKSEANSNPNAENIANAAISNSARNNEDYVNWR